MNERDEVLYVHKFAGGGNLGTVFSEAGLEEFGIVKVRDKTLGLHSSENVLVAKPGNALVVFKHFVPSDALYVSDLNTALEEKLRLDGLLF